MIIQVEYPKSGGTWLYKMLAYYLNIPFLPLVKPEKGDGFPAAGEFEDKAKARKQKYDGRNSHVGQKQFQYITQSHVLPNNALFDWEYCTFFLIRDGRDVITSFYHYEKYFLKNHKSTFQTKLSTLKWDLIGALIPRHKKYAQDFCFRNVDFSELFADYVALRAKEWRFHLESWLRTGKTFFKYEDVNKDPVSELKKILRFIGADIDEDLVEKTVALMSFKNQQKLEKDKQGGKFYRKGIIGDWKNHFDENHKETFRSIAGDTLMALGYEKDMNW